MRLEANHHEDRRFGCILSFAPVDFFTGGSLAEMPCKLLILLPPVDFFTGGNGIANGIKKHPPRGVFSSFLPVDFLNSLQRIYPPVAYLSTPLARSLKMSVRLKATTRSFLRLALRASVAAAYALTRTAAPQSLAPAIK